MNLDRLVLLFSSLCLWKVASACPSCISFRVKEWQATNLTILVEEYNKDGPVMASKILLPSNQDEFTYCSLYHPFGRLASFLMLEIYNDAPEQERIASVQWGVDAVLECLQQKELFKGPVIPLWYSCPQNNVFSRPPDATSFFPSMAPSQTPSVAATASRWPSFYPLDASSHHPSLSPSYQPVLKHTTIIDDLEEDRLDTLTEPPTYRPISAKFGTVETPKTPNRNKGVIVFVVGMVAFLASMMALANVLISRMRLYYFLKRRQQESNDTRPTNHSISTEECTARLGIAPQVVPHVAEPTCAPHLPRSIILVHFEESPTSVLESSVSSTSSHPSDEVSEATRAEDSCNTTREGGDDLSPTSLVLQVDSDLPEHVENELTISGPNQNQLVRNISGMASPKSVKLSPLFSAPYSAHEVLVPPGSDDVSSVSTYPALLRKSTSELYMEDDLQSLERFFEDNNEEQRIVYSKGSKETRPLSLYLSQSSASSLGSHSLQHAQNTTKQAVFPSQSPRKDVETSTVPDDDLVSRNSSGSGVGYLSPRMAWARFLNPLLEQQVVACVTWDQCQGMGVFGSLLDQYVGPDSVSETSLSYNSRSAIVVKSSSDTLLLDDDNDDDGTKKDTGTEDLPRPPLEAAPSTKGIEVNDGYVAANLRRLFGRAKPSRRNWLPVHSHYYG